MDRLIGAAPDRVGQIIERIRSGGHQAYLVGGCVRDLLLNVAPKDFDIATSARPEALLALFPGASLVGAHFGVVLVDGVEVATFRSDHNYSDGRHPGHVQFETSPAADAARRDFTVNGLFLDPRTGQVLDFVDGQRDLRDGRLRAIGDARQRFQEDHLRLLRAIRLAARYGFTIEETTFAAIAGQASAITRIAAERSRDELNRILTQGGARRGFELLDASGLLVQLLPEIAAMQGVAQPPQFHPEGDVWTHTLLMLEGLRSPSLTLAWGVLLHDVGKPPTFQLAERIRFDGHAEVGARMAEEILLRLRQSRGDTARIVDLVARHLDWMNLRQMREAKLKRFLRRENFDEHLELHRLDCVSSHRRLESYDYAVARRSELTAEALRPAPLLNGADLIAAGLRPGPAFGRLLEAVEDAQLEGRVQTRAEALALALSLSRE